MMTSTDDERENKCMMLITVICALTAACITLLLSIRADRLLLLLLFGSLLFVAKHTVCRRLLLLNIFIGIFMTIELTAAHGIEREKEDMTGFDMKFTKSLHALFCCSAVESSLNQFRWLFEHVRLVHFQCI